VRTIHDLVANRSQGSPPPWFGQVGKSVWRLRASPHFSPEMRAIGRIQISFVLLPPILREPPCARVGEDGRAEAFEQDGNLGQARFGGVHLPQQLLQLRHDPTLLGEGGEGDHDPREMRRLEVVDVRAMAGGDAVRANASSVRRNQCLRRFSASSAPLREDFIPRRPGSMTRRQEADWGRPVEPSPSRPASPARASGRSSPRPSRDSGPGARGPGRATASVP